MTIDIDESIKRKIFRGSLPRLNDLNTKLMDYHLYRFLDEHINEFIIQMVRQYYYNLESVIGGSIINYEALLMTMLIHNEDMYEYLEDELSSLPKDIMESNYQKLLNYKNEKYCQTISKIIKNFIIKTL
jgi:hypothetical protein